MTLAFSCHGLSHSYRTVGGGELLSLKDVSFDVHAGEFLSIVGPSGCGKTTLLRIIAGRIAPFAGTVRFPDGSDAGRRKVGVVFQEHGVFPWMTVQDNVAFGLAMRGVQRKERLTRARSFIDRVGLSAFATSFPHELSVGMRQRVGIARAFVSELPILLMDEPFGALDAQTKLVLQEELLRIWRDDKKVVVYVTHDIDEAIRLGDRVLVMSGRPGAIREDLPVPLARPRDLTHRGTETAALAAKIWQLLEAEVRGSLAVRT
ncbi:MAG: ABC transporter ATP-binding protein [Gemmatimonadota bacterium]